MTYSPPDFRREERPTTKQETLIKINNSLERLPKTEPYRNIRLKLLKHKLILEGEL